MSTTEFDVRDVDVLIRAASRAPSIHNTQPWRFRVADDSLELHLDTSRTLRVADADGRAATVSCGAALLNLRLAAAVALRREPIVSLVRRRDPAHLATVRLGGPSRADAEETELYEAIPRRHTDRSAYRSGRVDEKTLALLVHAAALEGVSARVVPPERTQRLLALTRRADRAFESDPAYREELAQWTGDRSPDGVPTSAFGPLDLDQRSGQRDFGFAEPVAERGSTDYEKDPQLLVLLSHGDRALDRIRAGQGLERLLLTATVQDVSVSFLDQALERADTRKLLRDPEMAQGVPQMALRVGHGRPGPTTPRRPITDVLDPGPE